MMKEEKQNIKTTPQETDNKSLSVVEAKVIKPKTIIINRSWCTYSVDGNLKDFGLMMIRHKESYAQWDDRKNDWDYISVKCVCEICKEENQINLAL